MGGQSHRNDDSLPHTSAELMCIGARSPRGIPDSNPIHDLDCASPNSAPVHPFVRGDYLGNRVANSQHRVERCERVLKDHGDSRSSKVLHIALC